MRNILVMTAGAMLMTAIAVLGASVVLDNAPPSRLVLNSPAW